MQSTVKINGMACQHCVMTVTKTLSTLEGVRDVKVNLEKGEVSFDHETPVDMNELRQKIQKAGFELG